MFTKHVKINQLDVHSHKLNSNNDRVLMETTIHIHINDTVTTISCVPSHIECLIYGFVYALDGATSPLTIEHENNHYHVTPTDHTNMTLDMVPIDTYNLHFVDIIKLTRQFKSLQTIYHDTGATVSVGIALNQTDVIVFEDLSLTNAVYKLIGHLLTHHVACTGIVFVSHALSKQHMDTLALLPFNILICQSALSAPVIDHCSENSITLLGFCRKNTYNVYTNYHIR